MANHVLISGPSVFVYNPERPLQCGAVAWVETTSEVTIG